MRALRVALAVARRAKVSDFRLTINGARLDRSAAPQLSMMMGVTPAQQKSGYVIDEQRKQQQQQQQQQQQPQPQAAAAAAASRDAARATNAGGLKLRAHSRRRL